MFSSFPLAGLKARRTACCSHVGTWKTEVGESAEPAPIRASAAGVGRGGAVDVGRAG